MSSVDDFARALAFTLRWEGEAFTEDPDDPGGATKWGISRRAHPELSTEQIRALTREQAAEIYRSRYWRAGHCDELAWPLSEVHFDACVNVGIRQAVRFVQRAAGVGDDGIFGPVTAAACRAADPWILAEAALAEREAFYRELAARRPALGKYLKGWLNRCRALREEMLRVGKER